MKKFEFDDLLSKNQEELNKIKTAIDIHQAEDKYAFEKSKFRTENLRFIVIALMTSFISLGSAYFIESFKQKSVIESENKKSFQDMKKSYLLEKDIAKRKEIACELANFSSIIHDSYEQKNIVKYKSICEEEEKIKEKSSIIAKVDTSSVKTKQIITELNKYEQEYSSLVQKKKTASQNTKPEIEKQIKDINSKVATIISENPEIKTAVASSKSIENNVESINAINTSIDNHKNSSKSSIQWFKEGYFLQFGEFRVLLLYLDKNLGIEVQVCKTLNSDVCEKPILDKKWIKYKDPLQFTDEGNIYQINLEDINHAGKNPFKLAAYITFEKK